MTTDLADIDDVVEVGTEGAASLRSPSDLYLRWERQHWSVERLDVARDAEAWDGLRAFAKGELLSGMAELHAGEVCVTETLTPLIDFAIEPVQRMYLATQLADEARHVRFFQDYLGAMSGPLAAEPALDSPFSANFDPALRRATAAVREQAGDPGAWYAGVVYYHVVAEGILAATTLRSLLALVRGLNALPALTEGLVNIARDESRHMSFGFGCAREGVLNGHGDRVTAALMEAIPLAAEVLIGAERRCHAPLLRSALLARASQLTHGWDFARTKMRRNLRLICLPSLDGDACAVWDSATERALDTYEERWGEPHPVRRAAAIPTID
jgi:ribonucleoside-diphosphate reductase beta chain